MDVFLKGIVLILLGCLAALSAWLVEVPTSAEANAVPEKYRPTVDKAIEYLLKHQCQDGHWEGDDGKHPVAMTGLVGLTVLMDGQSEIRLFKGRKPKHPADIKKAVDWLLARSKARRDGLLFSDHPSETARYMEGHGLAMIFLAGALEAESDKTRREKLREVLIEGVKYIEKAQSSRGGWYHTSKVEGHDLDAVLPTAIQIQALQTAKNCYVPVSLSVPEDGLVYLQNELARHEKKMGSNAAQPFDTAATLACLRIGGGGRAARDVRDSSKKWYQFCRTEIPVGPKMKFGRDDLTHYYYCQAMYHALDNEWEEYSKAMFDHLQSSQNKDGSWPASEGIGVGSLHSTALWCTVLQMGIQHPAVDVSL